MKMMQEDGYSIIDNHDRVSPGDIIMYFRNGDPQHSGIVVQVPIIDKSKFKTETFILSKWGSYQETIHLINDCPYRENCDNILFYRIHSVHHGERL